MLLTFAPSNGPSRTRSKTSAIENESIRDIKTTSETMEQLQMEKESKEDY